MIWEVLEDALGREAFGDLFAHIRMIHRKQKMRGTLEREFRDFVNPTAQPVNFIEDQLKPSAEVFRHILRPDIKKMNQYRLLKGLSQIDNQDWQPPAISFLVKNHSDSQKIDKFLKLLDRLAYYLFITRANINDRLSRYGTLLTEIEDETCFDIGSSLEIDDDDAWDLFETLNGSIYENQRTRKPILLKLDEILSDGTAHYDDELITIEHVLPQTPSEESEWLKNFPDAEFREEWVHSLANLFLLSRYKNPAASNYDFDFKKTKYFAPDGDSPFVLTNQVRESKTWNPKILEARQADLLSRFAQYWELTDGYDAYMSDD